MMMPPTGMFAPNPLLANTMNVAGFDPTRFLGQGAMQAPGGQGMPPGMQPGDVPFMPRMPTLGAPPGGGFPGAGGPQPYMGDPGMMKPFAMNGPQTGGGDDAFQARMPILLSPQGGPPQMPGGAPQMPSSTMPGGGMPGGGVSPNPVRPLPGVMPPQYSQSRFVNAGAPPPFMPRSSMMPMNGSPTPMGAPMGGNPALRGPGPMMPMGMGSPVSSNPAARGMGMPMGSPGGPPVGSNPAAASMPVDKLTNQGIFANHNSGPTVGQQYGLSPSDPRYNLRDGDMYNGTPISMNGGRLTTSADNLTGPFAGTSYGHYFNTQGDGFTGTRNGQNFINGNLYTGEGLNQDNGTPNPGSAFNTYARQAAAAYGQGAPNDPRTQAIQRYLASLGHG